MSSGFGSGNWKDSTRESRNAYEQLCALANRRQIPFIKKGAFFLPLLFDSLVKRRIAEKYERWEDGQGIVDTVETRDTHGPRDLCSPFF